MNPLKPEFELTYYSPAVPHSPAPPSHLSSRPTFLGRVTLVLLALAAATSCGASTGPLPGTAICRRPNGLMPTLRIRPWNR